MTTKLTPNLIAKMAVGDKIKDSEAPGLLVEMNRDGSRSWRYYRRMPAEHGGRLVKMTLGSTLDHSLPDARIWASGLSNSLVKGIDPREEKRAAREESEAATAATQVEVMTAQRAYEHYIQQITTTHGQGTAKGKISRWTVDIGPVVATRRSPMSPTKICKASLSASLRRASPAWPVTWQPILRRCLGGSHAKGGASPASRLTHPLTCIDWPPRSNATAFSTCGSFAFVFVP